MATTYTLTPSGAAFAKQPLTIAVALDSVAGSNVSIAFTDSAGGAFLASPVVITTGTLTGNITYTPPFGASGIITITAVASGGLVKTVTLLLTVNYLANGTSAMQLIAQALGMLEIKAAGEPVGDQVLADMFDLLNNSVLDGWRTDSLYAIGILSVIGILKAGVKTMTIGPTGDLPTPNVPIRIEDGAYFTSGNGNYPIEVMTDAELRGIFYPTLSTLGPDRVNYSPGVPNGVLTFYPQSGGDVPIVLPVLMQLAAFVDIGTTYQLAPGVRRALAYTLAEEAQGYFGKQLSPPAQRQASLARRNLQRSNHETPAFKDTRLQNRNILSGWER